MVTTQPDPRLRRTTLWFKVRDFLSPREKVLAEAPIRPGDTVVDYGCGTGGCILPLAERVGEQGRVYAVDAHPLAIERVRRLIDKHRLRNVRTIQTDALTGLPMGSVDVVCMYEVFRSLKEPERVMRELRRVLKREGVLSFSDHVMKHAAILAGVTRRGYFWLAERGKRTYIFSRG